MNDKDWRDKCAANYETEAGRLEAEGFERKETGRMIPVLFVKDGRVLYLARQLGSSKWYPVPMQGEVTWLEE